MKRSLEFSCSKATKHSRQSETLINHIQRLEDNWPPDIHESLSVLYSFILNLVQSHTQIFPKNAGFLEWLHDNSPWKLSHRSEDIIPRVTLRSSIYAFSWVDWKLLDFYSRINYLKAIRFLNLPNWLCGLSRLLVNFKAFSFFSGQTKKNVAGAITLASGHRLLIQNSVCIQRKYRAR